MSSILVVDDDAGIRTMLSLFLTHKGHIALEATNGREALDLLQQSTQTPCLILLDLMMPVMSGAEFRSEQQQDPALASIPVALISAAENLQELAPALNADISLEKPIDFDNLLKVVEQYCRGEDR